MKPNAAPICLLLLATLSPAAAPAGENVLVNAEFDNAQMEAGWSIAVPGGSGTLVDWTIEDSDACPGSGSVRIASSTTDVGTQWAEVGQCQPIDASAWTTGFHSAFSYFSYETLGLAYASHFYYSDTGCGQLGGSYLGYQGEAGPIGPGWHRVAMSRATIPPQAQSIFVAMGAEAYQLTRMELSVDRAYFGQRPVIFTDDFESVASPCRWSAAP
ncbi:MAG: hypothetical protein ABI689_09055 [Thermoanaerobaculia bacterium]